MAGQYPSDGGLFCIISASLVDPSAAQRLLFISCAGGCSFAGGYQSGFPKKLQ
ncbi:MULTISPECIES: hypothetical protein [Eisenbergiella]|uniref:hypothetical protein n=1 Tax=Eisenbergiella TaxID=1432051 RepID=UPI0023F19E39|nr:MULTISPECIES: hypothetical protein [Eisenbergiella]MCI6706183.1 hypothetical protein [Eisenbergiella massiliensis]MDY5527011.1 hypothetical protein [Eisenbergiella porci]